MKSDPSTSRSRVRCITQPGHFKMKEREERRREDSRRVKRGGEVNDGCCESILVRHPLASLPTQHVLIALKRDVAPKRGAQQMKCISSQSRGGMNRE